MRFLKSYKTKVSYHMLSVVEFANVLTHIRAADARVALHVHVVAQRQHYLKYFLPILTVSLKQCKRV